MSQDGEYTFKGLVKAAGWFILDGTVLWSEDRAADPGDHSQLAPELTLPLTKGLHSLDVLLRVQGGEHICTWHWIKPGAIAPDSIDTTECRPPADWRTRLKTYNPVPVPVTQDYTNPGATYQSPLIPPLFGPGSYWNAPCDLDQVDPNSDAIIASLNNVRLHPVFGEGGSGIPFEVIPPNAAKVTVGFTYADESDPGPYPLGSKPLIESGPTAENGGDAHWIGYAPDEDRIYEVFALGGSASARTGGSGAIFDARTGQRIPGWQPGWTSADAAGLPILPGLLRPEEVLDSGEINHALRCTVGKTQKGFVYPATHYTHAYPADRFPNYPPMGCRLRIKASTDISRFSPAVQTICRALKKYGTFVADNGSDSFIGLCGVPDARWDDDILAELKQLHASDFEVVRMGPVTTSV